MIDFRRRPNEDIDILDCQWDLARQEAASVGAEIGNLTHLSTMLIRHVGIKPPDVADILRPLEGRMPETLVEYDAMVIRIRALGHIREEKDGNVIQSLRGNHYSSVAITDTQEVLHTLATNDSPWCGTSSTWQGGYSSSSTWQPSASTWQPESTQAYHLGANNDEWSEGTDTDTSSACEYLDMSDLAHLSECEKTEKLYFNYKGAKRVFRRYANKPTRKVRRFFRKGFRRKRKE